MMFRQRSVDVHQFSMVPRADIPRSSFRMQTTHKTTFDAGYLVPVYVEEVLPGDTFSVRMTAFARLATPLRPIMDNMYLESFFFFVPNRLVWSNWKKFMGEQNAPGDSISYTIPQIVSPANGYGLGSLYDYFGLPTVGQVGAGNTVSHNALPIRAYALIYNEWFRDQNLITPEAGGSFAFPKGDGPDVYSDYSIKKRGKRHDYFTSALPWPQKGGTGVNILQEAYAQVKLGSWNTSTGTFTAGGVGAAPIWTEVGTVSTGSGAIAAANLGTHAGSRLADLSGARTFAYNPNGSLWADLGTSAAFTVNALRSAFQIQKVLERDARGGTRYTELVQSHFGVRPPDFRLQRPEYLGGGSSPVTVNPIAQTSQTGLTGGSTPQGNLAAVATVVARDHGFSQSFTEHGYVIGIVNVRADLTYQQGLHRMWNRSTRYDFYFPAFAMLGEQAILNKEIYCKGDANDALVFGYQERWAEYRYHPARISGYFRSTAAGTLDSWHLAQKFTALPALNATFINEDVPIDRVVATPAEPDFIFDSFFDIKAARPLPLYSVPGQIDRF